MSLLIKNNNSKLKSKTLISFICLPSPFPRIVNGFLDFVTFFINSRNWRILRISGWIWKSERSFVYKLLITCRKVASSVANQRGQFVEILWNPNLSFIFFKHVLHQKTATRCKNTQNTVFNSVSLWW